MRTQPRSGPQLARVLAQILDSQGPRLLLLDECTSALDPAHQQLALGLVRTLARTQGIAVLAIVHDLNLAAQFADRLVVLKAGRCVASGPAVLTLCESSVARRRSDGVEPDATGAT